MPRVYCMCGGNLTPHPHFSACKRNWVRFANSQTEAATPKDPEEAAPEPPTLTALIPGPRPLVPETGFVCVAVTQFPPAGYERNWVRFVNLQTEAATPEDRAEAAPEPPIPTALTPDPRPLTPGFSPAPGFTLSTLFTTVRFRDEMDTPASISIGRWFGSLRARQYR